MADRGWNTLPIEYVLYLRTCGVHVWCVCVCVCVCVRAQAFVCVVSVQAFDGVW